jgi:hypothetical protein
LIQLVVAVTVTAVGVVVVAVVVVAINKSSMWSKLTSIASPHLSQCIQ